MAPGGGTDLSVVLDVSGLLGKCALTSLLLLAVRCTVVRGLLS